MAWGSGRGQNRFGGAGQIFLSCWLASIFHFADYSNLEISRGVPPFPYLQGANPFRGLECIVRAFGGPWISSRVRPPHGLARGGIFIW